MGQVFLDAWSLTHVGWGIVIGSTKLLTLPQWIAVHTAYEAWENSGHSSVPKILSKHTQDSWINFLGDTLSALVGHEIGSWLANEINTG